MLSSIKLANLWRVISDVDLERIRASAHRPFDLLVVADEADLAERVRRALGAVPGKGVHPYVVAVSPNSVVGRPTTPLLVVLATATPELSAALKAVDAHCVRLNWPRLTLVTVDAPGAAARRQGEQARVAVVDPAAAPQPLLATIVDLVHGDDRLALAAALPVFRPAVAEVIVDETAKANASFAMTTGLAETIPVLSAPLNVGDMVVLTKNQLIMGYKIALAAGRTGEPRAMMTEILGVIGGGFLFRQVARQLVGLVPVAGLLPKVAIAYAGTYAIGRGLSAWALAGAEVTPELLSRYTSEGLGRGRVLAQQLASQVKSGVAAPARGLQRLGGWLPTRKRQAPPEAGA